MKRIITTLNLLLVSLLFTGMTCMAQNATVSEKQNIKEKQDEMKTYVIERDIPGAGKFTAEKLKSKGGFPANAIYEVSSMISPETANQ